MKKYLSLLVLGLALVSTGAVYAEDDATSAGNPLKDERMELKNEIKTDRDAFKADMDAKREAFKAQIEGERKAFQEGLKTDRASFLKEIAAKKAEFKAANMEKKANWKNGVINMFEQRFESAVKNIEKMQDRVSTKIDEAEAAGKDTTLAEASLANSEAKLALAKAKIAEVKALIPASGEITPELFEKIKLGARDAKNLLKESHYELIQAVKALKGLDSDDSSDDEDEDEDENEEENEQD